MSFELHERVLRFEDNYVVSVFCLFGICNGPNLKQLSTAVESSMANLKYVISHTSFYRNVGEWIELKKVVSKAGGHLYSLKKIETQEDFIDRIRMKSKVAAHRRKPCLVVSR